MFIVDNNGQANTFNTLRFRQPEVPLHILFPVRMERLCTNSLSSQVWSSAKLPICPKGALPFIPAKTEHAVLFKAHFAMSASQWRQRAKKSAEGGGGDVGRISIVDGGPVWTFGGGRNSAGW